MKKVFVFLLSVVWIGATCILAESDGNKPCQPRIVCSNQEVHFINQNGDISGSVSLKEEVAQSSSDKPDNDESRVVKHKSASISPNKQYAAIITNVLSTQTAAEKGKVQRPGPRTTTLELFDVSTNKLWKMQYSKGRYIPDQNHVHVTNDGRKTIAYSVEGIEDADYPLISVYDKKGREVLKLGEKDNLRPYPQFVTSPSGNYLGVNISNRVKKNTNSISTMFINTDKGSSWDSNKRYLVWEITDAGIAIVRDPDTKKTIELDVKTQLGE